VVAWLRWIHAALVILMVAVLVTCAAEAFLELKGITPALMQWVRWCAVAMLAASAIFLVLNDRAGSVNPGAVGNASGVAAMLALAARLHADPLEDTEILLLATGSKAAGLNGIYHFLRHQDLDRELTHFLNFDQVGAGHLAYTRGEGMLHVFKSARDWRALAARHASAYRVSPFTLTCVPTDMLIPAARGYKTLSIMGVNTYGVPPVWQSQDDVIERVDPEQIERAARFAEALIRDLGRSEPRPA
jgi:Zn-dependent M28 family amino/carboxypeptidase